MPLPFFDRRHRPKLPLPQLAKTLSDTLRGAIAEDPQKIDLLAHAFHCRPDEVRQHPRLLAILQKIEALFLAWLDPQTTMADVDATAQRIRPLHDQNGVSPSKLFAVMRRVQDKARTLNAPECFFACSNRFTLAIMEGQELTITSLQKSQAEEDQAYWQEIFNTQTEGLCIADLDGGFYDFNDAYAKLVGYSRKELLQKGWLDLTAPEYREEEQKRLPDVMAGKTVRFEKAYIHRDGHHVPILISYRLLKNRVGWDKDRIVATCVDLTEAKVQQKLEEERAYWWEIFNTQTEGLSIFDLDGGLYDFNDAYAKLVGYSREELLRKGWLELTPPEYREEDQKHLPDIMAGKAMRFEKAYIHRDGHHIPILISYRLLKKQPNWKKDRLVATCVELTQAKQQEEEARQLLEDAQTYLQHLAQAQLIHDQTPKDGVAQTIQVTYNQCVDHLQDMVKGISSAAHTLMTLSEELSHSQADLSDRSSKEAASLEEISANTEEITAMVSENSKHADETRAIAEDVRARLSTAAQSCAAVVNIIMDAAHRAQETTAITKAIQEIAFTTNILSLNASVEAARAGAEGKGFAVIAEEIRRLANRVGEESQRAEKIIGELVVTMDKGVDGLQAMAGAIDNVTAQASTMADHVTAIASACKEQDIGLQELAKWLNTLEEGLSQNASMAEEIHATSESLTHQTENLMEAIGRFQLDDTTSPIGQLTPEQDLARIGKKAMAAHHHWRQRLLKALQEGTTIDPKQVGDFQRCAFGQILASNLTIQAHPAYQRISQLHKDFHQEGQRIAELLRNGHQQQARQAFLEDNSRYNQLTHALAKALESLSSTAGQKRPNGKAAPLPPKSAKRPPSAKSPAKIANPDDEWNEF